MTARAWWRTPLPCPICATSMACALGDVTASTLAGRFMFQQMSWLQCPSCGDVEDLAEPIQRVETGLRGGSGIRVVDER